MRRIIIIFLTTFAFLANAQIFDPVDWEFSQRKISDNEIELSFKATIDDGWYIYSQHVGAGPVATEFTFKESDFFSLKGEVQEGEALEELIDTLPTTPRKVPPEVMAPSVSLAI